MKKILTLSLVAGLLLSLSACSPKSDMEKAWQGQG